jgi:NAD(P)-dependent dehydrogenase (short-subunit alcohol dehydrogenase family)
MCSFPTPGSARLKPSKITVKEPKAENFDNLFAINVRSPFFLVQELLPVLGEGSNVIVISSIVPTPWLGSRAWTSLRSLPTPRPKDVRDSGQELGCQAPGHPRKCRRSWRDRL